MKIFKSVIFWFGFDLNSSAINLLSTNPTKWANTLNSSAVADEWFECVWPCYRVGAWRVKWNLVIDLSDVTTLNYLVLNWELVSVDGVDSMTSNFHSVHFTQLFILTVLITQLATKWKFIRFPRILSGTWPIRCT